VGWNFPASRLWTSCGKPPATRRIALQRRRKRSDVVESQPRLRVSCARGRRRRRRWRRGLSGRKESVLDPDSIEERAEPLIVAGERIDGARRSSTPTESRLAARPRRPRGSTTRSNERNNAQKRPERRHLGRNNYVVHRPGHKQSSTNLNFGACARDSCASRSFFRRIEDKYN
jgi:hypothetical protein